MNQFIKSFGIWVKNCYVVVSEIANNRGKLMEEAQHALVHFMCFGTGRRQNIISTEYC